MHRQPLLEALALYRQGWPQEMSEVTLFHNFVSNYSDCFERSCVPGHLTASVCVLNGRDELLMLHHQKLDRWLQPGGHADGETDLKQVALKELHEETGLREVRFLNGGIFDVDRHLIPARKQEPEHYHYDVRFLLRADGRPELQHNHESRALKWVPLHEVQHYSSDPSILRMVDKCLAQHVKSSPMDS